MKKVKNNTIIQAGNGKVFRRISDGFIAGNSIHLGKTFYMGGRKLDKPITELPEHYEEIDGPAITEEKPAIGVPADIVAEIPGEVNREVPEEDKESILDNAIKIEKPRVITIQDIITLQEKVEKIYDLLTAEQKERIDSY